MSTFTKQILILVYPPQKEYYNVLNVASELLEQLEGTVMGKQITPDTIGRIAAQLFQQPDPADPRQSSALQVTYKLYQVTSNKL